MTKATVSWESPTGTKILGSNNVTVTFDDGTEFTLDEMLTWVAIRMKTEMEHFKAMQKDGER